jgi:hypothetical protein
MTNSRFYFCFKKFFTKDFFKIIFKIKLYKIIIQKNPSYNFCGLPIFLFFFGFFSSSGFLTSSCSNNDGNYSFSCFYYFFDFAGFESNCNKASLAD